MRASSTPGTSRNGPNSSNRHSTHHMERVEYSVDDSFNDSMLEEMGQAADHHYSNRARMQDLKIQHTPVAVKMVKKYIPTPNGIKVVEVPESTMKREIARSNLMRSGMSISRNNLLSRGPRTASLTQKPRKPASQRLSSFNSTSIVENVELERQAASSAAGVEERAQLANLHRQIEQEKQLARDLEAKRAEYEQLKALRLQNENRMQEIKRLEEEESLSRDGAVSPVSELNSTRNIEPITMPGAPEGTVPVFAVDEQKAREAEESSEEDVPIVAVPFAVDELEKKKFDHLLPAPDARGDVSSEYSLDASSVITPERNVPTLDPDNDVIRNYGALDSAEVMKRPRELPHDEFGIEEVENDEPDTPNLAQQLRPVFEPAADPEAPPSPKFDPVPEIIDDIPNDSLTPPAVASSIRSVSSMDSKPIKSAMKNSKTSYSAGSANAAGSPAHQAYLSLTTAENTRLNSKLSSAQLTEANGLAPEQNSAIPKSPNTQAKRMSQSLRKQPSGPTQAGMAGRSLRPHSTSDASLGRAQNGGMSARSFKTQPQPIPAHPALQPDYVSPSKLKAAELYARANVRPISVFQPPQRLSSFSKNKETPRATSESKGRPVPQQAQRTSLRPQSYAAPHPQPANAAAPTAQSNSGFKGFRSRLADSDDEDSLTPAVASLGRGGFKSRFNDSDDELPRHSVSGSHSRAEVMSTPIVSLRDQGNSKAKITMKEEKPKKKNILKKLFGRN